MAQVRVPPLMRDLTGGQATVRASGRTVAQVIEALDAAYPGFKDRLMPGGQLAVGLGVVIDGRVVTTGLHASVSDESDMRFLSVLGGG
jgi:sulfur-carrier protein